MNTSSHAIKHLNLVHHFLLHRLIYKTLEYYFEKEKWHHQQIAV